MIDPYLDIARTLKDKCAALTARVDELEKIVTAARAVDLCYRHMTEPDADRKLAVALDGLTEAIGDMEEARSRARKES